MRNRTIVFFLASLVACSQETIIDQTHDHVVQKPVGATCDNDGPKGSCSAGKLAAVNLDPDRFMVRARKGRVHLLTGRYDLGLDGGADGLETATAVSTFVRARASDLGLASEWSDLVSLQIQRRRSINDELDVARLTQFVRGVRIIDAPIVATFYADGALAVLSGNFVRPKVVKQDAHLADVLAVAGWDAKGYDGKGPDESGTYQLAKGTALYGYSDIYEADVWVLENEDERVLVGDDTGTVVHRNSQRRELAGPCNVRRRGFPRSRTRTTAIQEVAGGCGATDGCTTEQITCLADEFFGSCTWQLKRDPFGFPHGIPRVEDFNGGELQRQQACSSAAVPQFTNTNGDSLREQGAFYVQNQMRHFTNQNVWSQVSPERAMNVRITLDDPNVSTAFFQCVSFAGITFGCEIRCSSTGGTNFCSMPILSHEYGHYVVFSMGIPFGNCVAGVDEGSSIHESLANIFALLFWADDPEVNPQYGAASGVIPNNWAVHFTNNAPKSAQPSCPNLNDPTDGLPLVEAIWEIAFNRDCTLDTCVAASGFGNRIFPGLSQEQVLTEVGAALGGALVMLGTQTHDNVADLFELMVRIRQGNATARRVDAVLDHHGMGF